MKNPVSSSLSRGRRLFAVFAVVVSALSPRIGTAQAQILVQDNNGIAGFELDNNGLYYWENKKTACGDPGTDTIKLMPYRFDPAAPIYTRRDSCNGIQRGVNVTRDAGNFYFAGGFKDISRNSVMTDFVYTSLASNSNLSNVAVTAMEYHDGYVYYALRNTSNLVSFYIYRQPTNLTTSNSGTLVATGVAPAANQNYVNEIRVAQYDNPAKLGVFFMVGNFSTEFGDRGINNLYVKEVGTSVANPGTLLADSVTDFLVKPGFTPNTTRVWLTRFIGLFRSEGAETAAPTRGLNDVGGYLLQIDPVGLGVTTKHFDGGATFYSLAIDASRYYYVDSSSGTYHIHRNTITSSGAGTTIATSATNFANPYADGDWLYYLAIRGAGGNYLYRLPFDSTPPTLDVVEQGIEAIQTTQTLETNEGLKIPLVASKDTVVRGYGMLASNTTGETEWSVDARLRVYDDNVLVPDFEPRFVARLTGFTTPANVRTTLNLGNATSFYFVVPGRFITPGDMRFEMTLNASDIAPETATRANNTVSLTYTTRKSGIQVLPEPFDPETPSLIFRPMLVHDQPIIRLRNVAGIPRMIERMKSLVPFSEVTVEENDSVLQKNILGIDLGPWSMPGEQNWALLNLSVSTLTSNYLYGNLQVAMVPRGVPDFNGVAFPITATLVRMEDRVFDSTSFNQPRASLSLAHEWGHVAGILHIHNMGCGTGEEEPDGPYESPYYWDPCNIGPTGSNVRYMGFDRLTRTVIPPDAAGDLMAYRLPRWISGPYYRDRRWQQPTNINTGLRAAAPTDPRGPAPEQLLAVGALYDAANDSYQMATLFAWPSELAAQPELPLPVDGGFTTQTLTLFDTARGALFTQEIAPFPVGDGTAGQGMIHAWLPFSASVQSLEFAIDGIAKETILRSASPPDVQMGALDVDTGAGLVRLNWNAFDPDGDPVQAMLLYSNDGGTRWRNWGIQTSLQGTEIPIERLPGGVDCRFKLLFSDGMNTVVHDVAPFSLANHPPEVLLDGPAEGSVVPFGELINLCALALDIDQGSLPSSSLVWSIMAQDNNFGASGSLAQFDDLPPGPYTVEVSATDDGGLTGSTQRHFDVGPLTIPTVGGLSPVVDGRLDAAYNGGTTMRIPYPDGTYYEARLIHRDGRLCIGLSGMQYRHANAYGRLAGIAIDLDHSGEATLQDGDVAYFTGDDGVQVFLRASGGAYTSTTDPPLGFETAVLRSDDSWAAELCIDDEQIGGWNDLVGIQIGQYYFERNVWPPTSDLETPSTYAAAWFGEPGSLPAPTPLPPVANAGPDQRVNIVAPGPFYLSGQGSYDPEGGDLTYAWTQTGGPTVTLIGDDSETPSFDVAPDRDERDFKFELTVTTPGGNDTDAVAVTVAPAPAPFIFDLDVILNHILNIELRPADANQDGVVDVADAVYFIDNR